MEHQEIKSITKINKKDIVNVTIENIQKTVRETINKNSVIVTSSNTIEFKNLTLKNVSATINLDMKNATCLIIDENFKSEINLNIEDTYITTFYNEIVENFDEKYLNVLNDKLYEALNISSKSSTFSYFDINSYTEITNKQYENILREIHNVVSTSNLSTFINTCLTNVQQYNYIGAEDLEFGYSSDMDKEEYEKRKTNVKLLFDQANTSEILVKCIANTTQIDNVLSKVINKLSEYEELPQLDTEKINIDEQDEIENEESSIISTVSDPEKTTIENNSGLNTKIILIISFVLFLILFIILFILILFVKFKK